MKTMFMKILFVFLLLVVFAQIVSATVPHISDLYLETPVNNYLTDNAPENIGFSIRIYSENHSASTLCYLNLSNSTDSYPHAIQRTLCVYNDLCNLPGLDNEPEFEGVYTWRAFCESNESGTVVNTSLGKSHTIIFDRSPPVVSLNGLSSSNYYSGDVFTEGLIDFNFSAVDSLDSGNLSCDLYVDGSVVESAVLVPSGSSVEVSHSVSGDGKHSWHVVCRDNADPSPNVGTSSTSNFKIDKSSPVISLNSPSDGLTVSANTTQSFVFNVTDSYSATTHCDLQFSNTVVNSTVALNASLTTLNHKEDSGSFTWFVNCTDEYGNVASSEIRSITFGNSAASNFNLVLESPEENYLTDNNPEDVTFAIKVYPEDHTALTKCYLNLSNSTNIYPSSFQTTSCSYNTLCTLPGLDSYPELNGVYTWRAFCELNDSGVLFNSSLGKSHTIIFDRSPPVVSLNGLSSSNYYSGDVFTEGLIDFNFSAVDSLDSGNLSCDLYVDGVSVESGILVPNGSSVVVSHSVSGDGVHSWHVVCRDNADPNPNSGTSSVSNFIIDKSSPNIQLVSPNNTLTTAGNKTQNFVFNVTDSYSSNFHCDLQLSNVVVNSSSASNSSLTTLSFSEESGSFTWFVNCTDEFGNVASSETRTIIFDNSGPVINLSNAFENNYVKSKNVTTDFNFKLEDKYSTNGFTCKLFLNGENVVNKSGISNGTDSFIQNIFTQDGTYNWYISCKDQYGNSRDSEHRTIIANFAPADPILWKLKQAVSEIWLTITGYIDKYGHIKTSSQSILNGSSNYNETTTYDYPEETNYLGSTTVGIVYAGSNNTFSITDTTYMSSGNLTNNSYIQFLGHDRKDYLYYDVTNVSDYGTYYKITVSPNFEQTINVGELIYVYDKEEPTGWFNTSIKLHQGYNRIFVQGVHGNISGDTSVKIIYLDLENPLIYFENYSNVSQPNNQFKIIASDDYNLSTKTILVNFTSNSNGTNYYFIKDNSIYNQSSLTNIQSPNLICQENLTRINCSLLLNLSEDDYTVSLSIDDSFNHTVLNSYNHIVIRSVVLPVSTIQHTAGSMTQNATFLVNWTASPDPYLKKYQLSVGTLPGQTNIVNWFDVNKTLTTYLIENNSIQYGQIYYVNIRPIDEAGNEGPISSTELIYTNDPSPPQKNSLKIIANDPAETWIIDPNNLNLSWNFEDNETGVVAYEYAIGTTSFDDPNHSEWNTIISETTTNNSNGLYVSGLNLTEGQSYYLSTRAKNGNAYSPWSPWYSSSAVVLDSKPPTNISIRYETGNLIINSVTITYNVGNDSQIGELNVSGLDKAELLYKKADFRNNQCGMFSDWISLNDTLPLANPGVYNYNNLGSGKCYHFALKVYDQAGNYNLTTYNELVNLSVDTTPPSSVNISGSPAVIAENTLSFSWTPSEDEESGLKNYKCSLGTSPGSTDVTSGWLDCGLSTHTTLYNLSLTNAEIYYFNVQPVNNQGISGNISSSYGLLYFDMYPPAPLTTLQVGNDINGSDAWVDYSNKNYTEIKLSGEQNVDCIWSYYDVDYMNPAISYVTACTQPSLGNYICNITNLEESEKEVHISCKDLTGNIQTADHNTDIIFKKEMSPPRINITNPSYDGQIISELNPVFKVTIVDISSLNSANYSLYQQDTGLLLESNNLSTNNSSNNYEILLDLTNYTGELIFNVSAMDKYNRSSTSSRTFLVDHESPQMNILYEENNQTQELTQTIYLNTNKTLHGKAYFVNLTRYEIINKSGDLVASYNVTWTNTTGLSTIHEFNISLNASDFTEDGNYTLKLYAEGNNTFPNFNKNKTIIFDRENPQYLPSTIINEPSSIYENQTDMDYFIVVDEENLDSVWLNYSIDGTSTKVQALKTEPRPFHPDDLRFKATIPAYKILSNATIETKWLLKDKAGNENQTSINSLTVLNRKPNITSETISTGLATVEYLETIYFEDEDSSQTDFDCTINMSAPGLSINHTNNTNFCVLKWTNPSAGNYTLNITVFDKKDGTRLSNDSKQFNLTIYPNDQYDIDLDTDENLFNIQVETPIDYEVPIRASTDGVSSITIPQNNLINLTLFNDNFRLVAYDVPTNASSNFYFRRTSSPVQNSTYDVGRTSQDRYWSVKAYAINLSLNLTDNATRDYRIEFNYSKLGVVGTNVSRLKIIKYPFNEQTERILFNESRSGDGILTSTIDTSKKIIHTTIHNFSIVILAIDTKTATCSDGIQNQGETGVDCGGPCSACTPTSSHSSSSSSSSSFSGGFSGGLPPLPKETCSDGIQNQDETGVDCGGICKHCITLATCDDGIQNQDETGVDCGGLCKPCETKSSTCYDGILNQNEEKIDCGGVCKPCDTEQENKLNTTENQNINGADNLNNDVNKQTSKEYPRSRTSKSPFLLIMIGFLVIGGLIIVVIEAPRKGLFSNSIYKKITHFDSKDNIVTIARYIRKQKSLGIDGKQIEEHLLKNNFSQIHIDLAIHILDQEKELEETINYFEKYSLEGFTLPEMVDWLYKKGVDEYLLAIAVDLYKEKHKPN